MRKEETTEFIKLLKLLYLTLPFIVSYVFVFLTKNRLMKRMALKHPISYY